MPVISITGANSAESFSNFIEFTVSLSESALDAVTVDYRTLTGTTVDSDIDTRSTSAQHNGSISFAPGETSQSIFVEADQDFIDEFDESVVVELYNPSANATFQNDTPVARASGVILDDDGSGSNLALLVSDPVVTEGDGGQTEAVFELRLSRPAPSAFDVTYTTADISALAGVDYSARSGTVSFAIGQERASVSVPVNGDLTGEGTERFALVVTPPANPIIGTEGLVGEALVIDTDSSPLPEISIAGGESEESFSNFMRFVVTLSEPATDAVTVEYRTLRDTAVGVDVDTSTTSSQHNGTVTFQVGETSKDIFIEADSDSIDEFDENIVVELFHPSANAVLAGNALLLRANGVIFDDDGSGPNLSVFVSDPVLTEADGGQTVAVFEVALSRPAPDAFSMPYETADITAEAGEDYVAQSGTIQFAQGQQTAAVLVPVIGDTTGEPAERFALIVTPPATPIIGTAGAVGEALVLDTDESVVPQITVSGDVVEEAFSAFAHFVLTLSEPSANAVTVDFRVEGGGVSASDLDNGFQTGSVTFLPGQTTQSVFVEGDSDTTDERDESVYLRLSNPSGASFANGASELFATGFVLDNDGAGPNIAVAGQPAELPENGTLRADYFVEVFLSQASDVALSFEASLTAATAQPDVDIALLDNTVTFAPGQTSAAIGVRVLGDPVADPGEFVELVLAPTAGTPFVGTIENTRLTIADGPRVTVPTNGSDNVIGTIDADNIDLLAGNDTFTGLGGSDTIYGNAGDDAIYADRFPVAFVPETSAQVFRLYRSTLDRDPDAAGHLGWTLSIESGETDLATVAAGFVNSLEFQSVYGALTDGEFIELLYQNVLGRASDLGGRLGWLDRLANGDSRAEVVLGFSESTEFKRDTELDAFNFARGQTEQIWADDVFRLYRATLDRDPDATGFGSWTEQLGTGTDYLTVVNGFVNSPEFQATYGALSDTAFVELLYQNVLDRGSDSAGLQNWLDLLAGGGTRADVVQGFAQSQEFATNTADDVEAWIRALGRDDELHGQEGNNLLIGGSLSDLFVFAASDQGTHRVLDAESWDDFAFIGFGYGSAAAALANMTQQGEDVVFADQNVSVIFEETDLSLFREDMVFV